VWWDDLSDSELLARLEQHGVDNWDARKAVARRNDDWAIVFIAKTLT
jgi:hypothetical protein